MSLIPSDHYQGSHDSRGGLAALVASWLSSLSSPAATRARECADLRRQLDAFAWDLVGQMVASDRPAPEIPLDMDEPNR